MVFKNNMRRLSLLNSNSSTKIFLSLFLLIYHSQGLSHDKKNDFPQSSAPNLGPLAFWSCESASQANGTIYRLLMRLRKGDQRLQITLAKIKPKRGSNLLDLAVEQWEPKNRPIQFANEKAGFYFDLFDVNSDLIKANLITKGVLKETKCCFNYEAKLKLPMDFKCQNILDNSRTE